MDSFDVKLKEAEDRTMAAIAEAHKSFLHNHEPASSELPENERITGVRCRRRYIGIVPWRVCINCDYHCHTVYDMVKRPVVTCQVNRKQEEAQTIYEPEKWNG